MHELGVWWDQLKEVIIVNNLQLGKKIILISRVEFKNDNSDYTNSLIVLLNW